LEDQAPLKEVSPLLEVRTRREAGLEVAKVV
jgi:hypothetical protein